MPRVHHAAQFAAAVDKVLAEQFARLTGPAT